MNLIEKYPTVAMFLSFFVSSCIFAYLNPTVKAILICTAVLFILFIFILSRTDLGRIVSKAMRFGLCLILTAVIISGCISIYFFDVRIVNIEKNAGKEDNVLLEIEDCVYSVSYASEYIATIKESSCLTHGTKVLLNTEAMYFDEGTIVSGNVTYSTLDSVGSTGFDSERYYLSKNIMLVADADDLEAVGVDNSINIGRFFSRINRRLTSMLVAHCGYNAGGFASAVLLGNKSYLSDSIQRDFTRLGTTHLLVISGTHFSVIVAMLESAFKKTKIKRKHRAMINIAVILFMMGVTGFSASVVRAGVMHLLVQVSILLFRRANIVNSFAIAGTILVLVNPYATLDCGLQLSFLATYSCIMFQMLKGSFYHSYRERFKAEPRRRSRIGKFTMSCLETIVMTTLVTICTMPLIWLYFGEISLISIPANLIFIPMISVFMYVVCAYLLLYPVVIFIYPLSLCITAFTTFLANIASVLSSGKWVMLSIDYDFSVYFLIPMAALLILVPLVGKRARVPMLLASLSVCVVFFGVIFAVQTVEKDQVRISYITEKKNDGFVIKASGEALICDISDASYGFIDKLVHEAKRMNLCEIEYVMLTHYHNKHIGLLSRLYDRQTVRCIVLTEPTNEQEESIFNSIAETAESRKVNVLVLPRGGSMVFGDTVITLCDRVYISRSSHPITAIKIDVGEETTVYLSGAFNEGSEEIVSLSESADSIIFGVHSPVYKKSFGISLIGDPKVMIVSDNAYEYMEEELKKYADSHPMRLGSSVYRQVIKTGE